MLDHGRGAPLPMLTLPPVATNCQDHDLAPLAIRHRVELLINLPAAAIDKLAIQQSARDLAKR